MPKLTGFVDVLLRRPLVQIKTAAGIQFTCLVDTGFNQQLLMEISNASALGARLFPGYSTSAQIPGHQGQGLQLIRGSLSVNWVNGTRPVEVLVDIGDQDSTIYLGTRLLHPDTLEIHFLNDYLEIR